MLNAHFILPEQSFVHKTAFPWNVSVIFVNELSAHPVYFTAAKVGCMLEISMFQQTNLFY
jgi:hypothetical protein